MTRGHGSGRATTPEKERARREKIREAAVRREARFREERARGITRRRVRVSASWRSKSRSESGRSKPGEPGRHRGWSYDDDGDFVTMLMTSDDAEEIRRELNRRHPTREFYNVRVEDAEE